MKILMVVINITTFVIIRGNLFEPSFDNEDLNYDEYKEYVEHGWLNPNYYVEKSFDPEIAKHLDGYELINEKSLIPNIHVGYLPVKETPLEYYEIYYKK